MSAPERIYFYPLDIAEAQKSGAFDTYRRGPLQIEYRRTDVWVSAKERMPKRIWIDEKTQQIMWYDAAPSIGGGKLVEYRRFSPEDIDTLAEKILEAVDKWVVRYRWAEEDDKEALAAIKRVLQEETK